MAAIQTDKRRQELCFTTPGEVPTIPSPPGLQWGDPGFTATDIMPGEFAINLPDRKVFFRSGNTIVQIISNEQLTLALNAVLGSIPSGSDDLTNDSTNVAGATVTEALDNLQAAIPSGSDDLTNNSRKVEGNTVTDALDVLAASIATANSFRNIVTENSTVTHSTSMVEVDGMRMYVDGGKTYIFAMYGRAETSTDHGGRIGISAPPGAEVEWQVIVTNGSSNNNVNQHARTSDSDESATMGTTAGVDSLRWRIDGVIRVGATPGNLSMQVRSLNSANKFYIHRNTVFEIKEYIPLTP